MKRSWVNYELLELVAVYAVVDVDRLDMSPTIFDAKDFQPYKVIYLDACKIRTKYWIKGKKELKSIAQDIAAEIKDILSKRDK